MNTPVLLPHDIDYLLASSSAVADGRELLLQAVSAWEEVMRMTNWDSPAAQTFVRSAQERHDAVVALAQRAQGWRDEISWVLSAGVCG